MAESLVALILSELSSGLKSPAHTSDRLVSVISGLWPEYYSSTRLAGLSRYVEHALHACQDDAARWPMVHLKIVEIMELSARRDAGLRMALQHVPSRSAPNLLPATPCN